MADIERRFADLESAVTGRKLTGYAAVYGQRSDIGPYLEMLAPTAFDSVLASPGLDCRGLLNHDPSLLLARTPKSLRLSSDTHGLQFEMDLPDTSVARDVRALVEAGLLTGCSFAFVAGQQEWSTHDGRDLRIHTDIARLLDVSVVTYPAYDSTNVSLRSTPTDNGRSQLIRARARITLKGNN